MAYGCQLVLLDFRKVIVEFELSLNLSKLFLPGSLYSLFSKHFFPLGKSAAFKKNNGTGIEF